MFGKATRAWQGPPNLIADNRVFIANPLWDSRPHAVAVAMAAMNMNAPCVIFNLTGLVIPLPGRN